MFTALLILCQRCCSRNRVAKFQASIIAKIFHRHNLNMLTRLLSESNFRIYSPGGNFQSRSALLGQTVRLLTPISTFIISLYFMQFSRPLGKINHLLVISLARERSIPSSNVWCLCSKFKSATLRLTVSVGLSVYLSVGTGQFAIRPSRRNGAVHRLPCHSPLCV